MDMDREKPRKTESPPPTPVPGTPTVSPQARLFCTGPGLSSLEPENALPEISNFLTRTWNFLPEIPNSLPKTRNDLPEIRTV